MPTLRELAAESIGRITRRGLEPQLSQLDAALRPGEPVGAVTNGHDGPAGVVIAVTGERVLLSSGAPFTQPALVDVPLDQLRAAVALEHADGWALQIEWTGGNALITGMADRDAQRLAVLLESAITG